MPHHHIYIHQLLIDYMNHRSYPVPSNGICLGIASMGIQALLPRGDELKIFCERLNNILAQLSTPIPVDLSRIVFTPEQQKDINIFFEGVLLYQMAYKYKKLLTHEQKVGFTMRNYRPLVFNLIKPVKLDNRNMYTLSTILGCYSINEIEKFLNILKTAITKILYENPVGLMLYIHNHIIALGYSSISNTWTIIDANMLYILNQTYSCQDTAKLLSKAFTMKSSIEDNIKVTFSTELITTIDDVNPHIEIQHKFLSELNSNDEWEQIHRVTLDKLSSTDDGSSWLFMASKDGNLPLVTKLLEAKSDVNLQKNDNGTTPLWAAVQENHLDVVIALLDARAKVDIPNKLTGTTPLIIAAQNNYIQILDLLLEDDAYVNHQNKKGVTALLAAVQNNNLDSIKLLIKAEANVNLTAENNITPLRIAVESNHYKIVKELMKAKARLDNFSLDDTDTVNSNKEEDMGEKFLHLYDSRDFEGFYAIKQNSPPINTPSSNSHSIPKYIH